MNTLEKVAAELLAADQARPRSQQTESGASSVGSCRAQLLLRATGAEPSDVRFSLAPIVGTAVHAACEQAAGPGVLTEQVFVYRGIRCTIDRYDPHTRTLTDHKSKATPVDVDKVRQHGPSRPNRLQVHLGAAALLEAGHPVDTVELLFLPRSGGGVEDCWLWSEPFDKQLADEAADWLLAERFRAENFASPAGFNDLNGLRDESWFFCRSFCEFFTLCRGQVEEQPSEDDLADAAARYDAARRAEDAAKQEKQDAARDLAGFTGTAGDWQVSWTEPRYSRLLDLAAIKAQADTWRFVTGTDLPVKESYRAGSVSVKPVKS